MPIVNGPIDAIGPVVTILVGVSEPRQLLLVKHAFPVPKAVEVRALLDTGSGLTALDPSIFRNLDLTPVGKTAILTPSTGVTPHDCDE